MEQKSTPPDLLPSKTSSTRMRLASSLLSLRKRAANWGSAPECLALLTLVLVFLTVWLIVATYGLEHRTQILTDTVKDESNTIKEQKETIAKESTMVTMQEGIVQQQAMDQPPQVELVAHVTPPLPQYSAGQIVFRNQGSSYVQVAYAWCWGDDINVFNTNKPSYVQDARRLRSIVVRGSASVDFAACSGKVGQAILATKPRYLYTFTVYETPSHLCKNRQQWFSLVKDRSQYQVDDDVGNFPANLNYVARIRIKKEMQKLAEVWNRLEYCLSPSAEL